MSEDYDTMEDPNRSANADIHSVSDPARRCWAQGGLGALAGGLFAPWLSVCAGRSAGGGPLLGYKSIPATDKDTLVVPQGYQATVIAAWGEPVGVPGNMLAWRAGYSNSAADQALQTGMHHDGLHYVPLHGNIQQPAETPTDRSDPTYPAKFSNWPDYKPGGRPRSATVVIQKKDGGVIGS